ncbi:MAG: ribonuclease HII [Candidatus Omnitrophota bacterium]
MKKKDLVHPKRMLLWEKKAFLNGRTIIIGLDEAGRGPLAGPVVACACLLNPSPIKRFKHPKYDSRIDDSKKLSPRQRAEAFQEISKNTLFGISEKPHTYIDKKNIYQATLGAMRQAVKTLLRSYCKKNKLKEKDIKKDICILVDGDLKLGLPYKTISIIKGDSKCFVIACASILAKVTRDRIMEDYDKLFPQYGFVRHKGYGTARHIKEIKEHGPCPIHRKSFAPIKKDESL